MAFGRGRGGNGGGRGQRGGRNGGRGGGNHQMNGPGGPMGPGGPAGPGPYGFPAGYGGAQGYGYGDYDAAYGGFGGGYGGGYGGPPQFGAGYPPQDMPSPLDAEIQHVLREIQSELATLDSNEQGEQFRNARRLLNSEKERLENNIDPEWLEVDIPKPVKVVKKILIPVYRHPTFNFVGKILGPKGATLQSMAKTHKCHIYVLGRGSTKDQAKEAEQLNSGDPQYAHFGGPLHVKIETVAPSHVAYARVAAVIDDLSRILQPVHEDTTPSHLKEKEKDEGKKEENGNSEGADGNAGENQGESQGSGGGNRGKRGGRGQGGRGGRGGGGPGRGRGGRGGGPFGFRPY